MLETLRDIKWAGEVEHLYSEGTSKKRLRNNIIQTKHEPLEIFFVPATTQAFSHQTLTIDAHWEFSCSGSDGVPRIVHIISEGNKVPGHIVCAKDPASTSSAAGTPQDDREAKIFAEIAAAAAKQRSLRASQFAETDAATRPTGQRRSPSPPRGG